MDYEKQERLFSLGCYMPSFAEEEYFPRADPIGDQLEQLLQDCYGTSWKSVRNKGDKPTVIGNFYQGYAVNYMLAWHLEDEYPYRCQPEEKNSNSQFDVTIFRNEIPYCGIELKRIISSKGISKYLKEHRDKCSNRSDTKYTLLAFLYPISEDMDPIRTNHFVCGYGRLSAKTHHFYKQEENYVVNIPAPLFRLEDGEYPLSRITDSLRNKLGISR